MDEGWEGWGQDEGPYGEQYVGVDREWEQCEEAGWEAGQLQEQGRGGGWDQGSGRAGQGWDGRRGHRGGREVLGRSRSPAPAPPLQGGARRRPEAMAAATSQTDELRHYEERLCLFLEGHGPAMLHVSVGGVGSRV